MILYTGHNDRGLLDRALEAGARGFVLKEGSLESLEEAVRTVADGGTWVDSGLATAVASPATVSALPPLTPREREILASSRTGSPTTRSRRRSRSRPRRCSRTYATRW